MRVLQMGPYPPPHGGVQTNLVAIRQFLLAKGIPCPVINLTRYRKNEEEEIYYPKNALDVLRLLKKLQYDVIHLHFGGNLSSRLLWLGLACCLMPRSKTVLTFHSGGYPRSEAGKKAKPFTLGGFVLRKFDRVIGVNQELEQLFQKFGVAEDRIRLIYPHSVSLGSIAPSLPEHLAQFYQAHTPNLVTLSGLEPEYQLSLQIEALGEVRKRFPNAGLTILGSGSLEADVKAQIQRMPYAEHVLLWGDAPHATALRAVADADLFLRTTLYDGDSISVREALAIGTPVIATDNGMRPDGVHLTSRSDSMALCRTIERVLTQAQRQPQAETGEQNLEEVFALYQELLQGNELR